MKLRTSFFNGGIFRKNVTRFAPAWVLYTVLLLMFMVLMLDMDDSGVRFADSICYAMPVMSFFNLCYALICGQLLFGDLFNSRMCNALHAMPLRRECWFFTNVISGLAFSLVPNLLLTAFALPLVGGLVQIPLLWLVVSTLQYLFFFGTAVLSAYCVGNRFAMVLVYAILNGFSLIVYWLVDSLYAPMIYGIQLQEEVFLVFCPFYCMAESSYVSLDYRYDYRVLVEPPTLTVTDGWGYTVLCAAIGLVYLLLALMLYRKRNLERAGDLITVRRLSPVFLLLYTLCAAACIHGFFSIFLGEESLGFLLVGLTIGFFTGRMLLDRTVRVFKKRNILIYIGVVAAVALSLVLTRLDPLGITRWVPRAEQVQSIQVVTGGTRYDYAAEESITDSQGIQDLLTVHRYGVNNRDAGTNGKADVRVYLTYTMKSGAVHSRYYYVDTGTEASGLLEDIMSRPELVLGFSEAELEDTLNRIEVLSINGESFAAGELSRGLLEALLLDCRQGYMAQDWNFHSYDQEFWISLVTREENGQRTYRDVRVWSSCPNTMLFLSRNNLLPEDMK